MACHPAAVVELTLYPFTSAMLDLYSSSILVYNNGENGGGCVVNGVMLCRGELRNR